MSDHYPISFNVGTMNTVNDKNKVKTITYKCFKTFQEQHLMNVLSKYVDVLDDFNIIDDQDIAFETIYTIYNT